MDSIDVDTNNLVENCSKIITNNFKITHDNNVLIFFDSVCPLSFIIAKGYVRACEVLKIKYEIINFYEFGGLDDPDSLDEVALSNFDDEKVKSKVEELNEGDLVILSQSSSFRMSKYRWRNLLHDLNLKVAEHAHMRMNEPEEYNTYINM